MPRARIDLFDPPRIARCHRRCHRHNRAKRWGHAKGMTAERRIDPMRWPIATRTEVCPRAGKAESRFVQAGCTVETAPERHMGVGVKYQRRRR